MPKHYMPLAQGDTPDSVHAHISQRIQESLAIRQSTIPRNDAALPGVASPEEPNLANIHFAKTVATIARIVELQAKALHYGLTRVASQTFRDYIGFLAVCGALDESLAAEIVPVYERARFDVRELEVDEFKHLMRLVTLVISDLTVPAGWHI